MDHVAFLSLLDLIFVSIHFSFISFFPFQLWFSPFSCVTVASEYASHDMYWAPSFCFVFFALCVHVARTGLRGWENTGERERDHVLPFDGTNWL